MIDSPITHDELHAYLDGELPPDRRPAVETWLASHPDDDALVAAWRAQAEAIRARYADVIHEPVPARLNLAKLSRPDRTWLRYAAAATILAFIAGGIAGWLGRGASAAGGARVEAAVTADAVGAHKLYVVEVRHPIEVAAGEEHLIRWLSKRLGYEMRAPDLKPLGLKFLGGRLLPGVTNPAAFLMYESASGERFTIYCTRAKAPVTSLRYRTAGPVSSFYWADDGVAYVLTGPADRDRLLKIAEAAYEQMENGTRTERGS
jgi:anti-sigma factor RsiW